MALQIQGIPREFTFERDGDEIKLPDPNPNMTPDEVRKFYSAQYPEIISSEIEGPEIKNDKAHYKVSHKAGRKG